MMSAEHPTSEKAEQPTRPSTSAKVPSAEVVALAHKLTVDEEMALRISDAGSRYNRLRPLWPPIVLIGAGYLMTLQESLFRFALPCLALGYLLALAAPFWIYVRHVGGALFLKSLDLDPEEAKEALRFAKKKHAGTEWFFSSRKHARAQVAKEILAEFGEGGARESIRRYT